MFCCLTESVVSSHKLICHFLSKKIKNLRRRVRLPGPYGNFIGSLFMHINNHIWTGIRETGCESLESDIIWYIPSSFFCRKKEASWKSWNFKGMCFTLYLPLEERNRVEIVRTGPRAILIGCLWLITLSCARVDLLVASLEVPAWYFTYQCFFFFFFFLWTFVFTFVL